MAAWTHCSWAYKKATAFLTYRMWASNQSRPKGGEATATRPKFRNTGRSILKAEVTGHSQGCHLATHCRSSTGLGSVSTTTVTFESHSKPGGMPLIFQRGNRGSAESTDLAKSQASYVWLLDHWSQSLGCTIYSTLPLSLKTDTLLVPTTDSQFWEDLSYSNQRIPKFKGKRDKGERYFCFNELLW